MKVRFEVVERVELDLQSVQLVLQVLEELLETVMPEHYDVGRSDGFGLLGDSLPDQVK